MEHFSIRTMLVSMAGFCTGVVMIVNRISEHRRIRSMVSYDPPLQASSSIWGTCHLWRRVIFPSANWRICFTADPENIKAVRATQFHSFGEAKKEFHNESPQQPGSLQGRSLRGGPRERPALP
ncbi:hypothetical protein Trco_000941 [Trichoderma cornu-damae]|uniref:Uncharacterized protein n=1 Tax=Trichoderma cornu-damae TaxID=654480 RepID=A0A9P8QT34_9HYPO|nr:hypothetical protein Trco_000941 [Trichoderma cornu-damae]